MISTDMLEIVRGIASLASLLADPAAAQATLERLVAERKAAEAARDAAQATAERSGSLATQAAALAKREADAKNREKLVEEREQAATELDRATSERRAGLEKLIGELAGEARRKAVLSVSP